MRIRFTFIRGSLLTTLFILTFAALAQAQATRTWVSGVGDDANPCSRTAPCKTYFGAISKTAAGGEISTLDPGGFGATTITKSITIDGTGTLASILASDTNGITINAGVNDVVTIRGIAINGAGTNPGFVGIRILQAKTVIIEDCVIFGFLGGSTGTTGIGIYDARTTGVGNLYVTNTNIRNNRTAQILINPTGTATVNGVIDNVRLENSTTGNGLMVQSSANMIIRNSVISGNVGTGIYAEELSGNVDVNVENCSVTNNGIGVATISTGMFPLGGSSPMIRLSNTAVMGNNAGLSGTGNYTFGNNKIAGNNSGNQFPTGKNIAQQ